MFGLYTYCMLHLITLKHTHTHTLGRTPLDERSARRRGRHLTTHNIPKKQNVGPPGVIRTRSPSMRTAADPRLKPHGHHDQLN